MEYHRACDGVGSWREEMPLPRLGKASDEIAICDATSHIRSPPEIGLRTSVRIRHAVHYDLVGGS